MEYAGSNLSHYVFEHAEETTEEKNLLRKIKAASLTNRIFLIADQDKNKDKKHTKLAKLDNDNFKYYPLDVIEVENLISPNLLTSWLNTLRPFKGIDLSETTLRTSEYRNERMGYYLKSKFPAFPTAAVSEPGGTLVTEYKNKLADYVASNVKWESMTNAAKDLTKSLYEFIKKHNS